MLLQRDVKSALGDAATRHDRRKVHLCLHGRIRWRYTVLLIRRRLLVLNCCLLRLVLRALLVLDDDGLVGLRGHRRSQAANAFRSRRDLLLVVLGLLELVSGLGQVFVAIEQVARQLASLPDLLFDTRLIPRLDLLLQLLRELLLLLVSGVLLGVCLRSDAEADNRMHSFIY